MRFPSQAAVQPGNFPPDTSRVVNRHFHFMGLKRWKVSEKGILHAVPIAGCGATGELST